MHSLKVFSNIKCNNMVIQSSKRSLSLLQTSKSVTVLQKGQKYPIPSLVKVVATIGPASEQLPELTKVVDAGMKLMRINFSHATYEEAELRTTNLRKCASLKGTNENLNSIMLDTQGPEIRTGSFKDVKEVVIETGNKITLTTDEQFKTNQSANTIWISYDLLSETVKEGSSILLDDGAIELTVTAVEKGKITCVALNKGTLGNKKGVNIPGESVKLPAMSDKDKTDIHWGIKNDIDFIAASFTRKASDIKEIRNYVASLMSQYHHPTHPHPKIISKIESTEALANFDSILEESDAIMVARGDLGVEVPMETLTNLQKEIVRKSNLAGKPVIVATQMLESMQKNPRPTRAECTDVTNAVFDGADCVMLSGESAKGKYPYQSVNMMKRIVDQAEAWINSNRDLSPAVVVKPAKDDTLESVSHAAVEISKNVNAACIIVISKDGSLATTISKFRPLVPILAFVSSEKIGRLLQIHRGIYPVADKNVSSGAKGFSDVVEKAQTLGYCGKHQTVVVLSAERSGYDLAYHTTVDVVSII